MQDRSSIGARVAGCKIHLPSAVPDNGRTLTDRERERLQELDLVTALRKRSADVGWDGLLHLDIAAFEGVLGEAWLFERGLDIHSVVDDIGDELRVRLCLFSLP